jgi:flagellar basal body rod protein FlgF
MDRSVYVAMTGATQIMRAQDAVSHNLANASTVGFKSELNAFQSVPVLGQGLGTRINAVAQGIGQDVAQGTISTTGRSLDVSVQGSGWIAVQTPDGNEGYTRAGDLQLTADGGLTDSRGTQAPTDADVRLSSGTLEGSNVNPSAELVKMISLSRQYDMQVKSIRTSEDNADSAKQLLQAS